MNARFALIILKMRLFMAMLSRTHRDDVGFSEMHSPATVVITLARHQPKNTNHQQFRLRYVPVVSGGLLTALQLMAYCTAGDWRSGKQRQGSWGTHQ